MPYHWTVTEPGRESLQLRPNRSLPPRGFAGFILATFLLLMIPLLPLLGTAVLWGVLPFILATLALLWGLLRRSYRDGTLTETLTLTPGHARLVRETPNAGPKVWEADPYSIQVRMHPKPVENYLTLSGGPREVEIGAFLSPEERAALRPQLEQALARAAGYGLPSGQEGRQD